MCCLRSRPYRVFASAVLVSLCTSQASPLTNPYLDRSPLRMGNGPSAASRSCCRRRQPALLVVKTEYCDHWELLRACTFGASWKLIVRGLTRLAAKRITWNRLGNHLKELKALCDDSRRANVLRRRLHNLGEDLKVFRRRGQQVQE